MKKIVSFILLISCSSLFSFTIVLNSAKEKREDYSILHIFDGRKFPCKKEIISITKERYICTIGYASEVNIKPKKTKLVNISFVKDKNNTKIIIEPKYKVKVAKISSPLCLTAQIGKYRYKKAKHWIFLFFKNSTFLKSDKQDIGIDFPIFYTNDNTPSVGALDLNGVPVKYIGNSKDISAYLSIKDDYDKQRYRFVISEVDEAMRKYSKSIFLNDFMLYKIRAMSKILNANKDGFKTEDLDYDQIIQIGKKWIKQFPSNRNIPEVLYHIAQAFQNLGQNSDAKYFYDILITEHPKDKYTKLGIISFADSLYMQNKKQKAIKLYKDILYSAKDIDVASISADRLANVYLSLKKIKKAKKYYKKIIDANPDYFLKDNQKAYDFALKLSRNKMGELAVEILQKLLLKTKKEPDLRGDILKNIADIYKKLKNKKMASKYYKEYLKEFRYGQYSDEVKKSLDGLFFDIDETNSTKLLKHYDSLMKKYNSGNIYQKAGILKAKLLIKLGKYSDALSFLNKMKYDIKNKEIILKLKKAAAKYIVEKNLKESNCLKAIEVKDKYKPDIDNNLSKNLCRCYIDTNNYNKALKLSTWKLKNSNLTAKEKFFWLNIKAKIAYKKREFKKLLMIANDLLVLGKSYDIKDYKEALYYKFFALIGIKNYNKALQISQDIENVFKNRFKNIEVFQELVKYAKSIDNNIMVIKYAKKIIDLQNRYKSYVLSPNIELDLMLALKKLHRYKEAIDVGKSSIKMATSKEIKARLMYELGDIYLTEKDIKNAKNIFLKCSKITPSNGWVNLCKESLNLY